DNLSEAHIAGVTGDVTANIPFAPVLELATAEQKQQLERLSPQLKEANDRLVAFRAEMDPSQAEREQRGRDPGLLKQLPGKIQAILTIGRDQRNDQQKSELRIYYVGQVSPRGKELTGRWTELSKAVTELKAQMATTFYAAENPQPRDTHILKRGRYDLPGPKVTPG